MSRQRCQVVHSPHNRFVWRSALVNGNDSSTILKRQFVSRNCSVVYWLNCVNLSSLGSTLDLGTPKGETTPNKRFTMVSDWFFNFGAFLDRENRYICPEPVNTFVSKKLSFLKAQPTPQASDIANKRIGDDVLDVTTGS